jgi:hypothetical protein
MRPAVALAASTATALALCCCSWLVSTSDLSGGGGGNPDAPNGPDATVTSVPDGGDAGAEAAADDPSLVGAWSFDTVGSGGTVPDVTGHGHTAQLVGTTVGTDAGVRGGGVILDTGTGFVDVPDLNAAAFPRSGTLSFWFLWTSMTTDTEDRIFSGYSLAEDHLFVRHANADTVGIIQVALQPKAAAEYVWEADFPVPANHWAHLVLTWDEVVRRASVFLDGTPEYTGGYTAAFAPSGQIVRMGESMHGRIDEVRLYNRVMTDAEASQLQ